MSVQDPVTEFTAQRGRLFGLAYRLLGSAVDAEDVVQEAFLRWSGADHASITAPGAWLARTVTNLSLTMLNSARARRESYVGPWLPEPVLTEDGPDDRAQQHDSVSLAMLTLLERLTPTERAVFVLREAFGYDHDTVAGILGTTPANSRQLHSRARRRIEQDRAPGEAGRPAREADRAEVRRLVERFLAAAREGDLARLESTLAADVVSWSDGGGRVSAARHPVAGATRVARLFLGLVRKAGQGAEIEVREVNGEAALVAQLGGLLVVVTFEVAGGRITAVRAVVNPDKVSYLRHQLSRSGELSSPS